MITRGIHYPLDYVGYERAFLNTFIELLDTYCTGCHTNDDVKGYCVRCPVGKLVYASKDYILKAYESDLPQAGEEKKLIRKIKREIKDIHPHPFFNGNWVWQNKLNPDCLGTLRRDLTQLEFMTKNQLKHWEITENITALYRGQFELDTAKSQRRKTNGRTNKATGQQA